jgi:hypothetical protein
MDRDLFDEYEGAGHAEFCFQVLISHLWKCTILRTSSNIITNLSVVSKFSKLSQQMPIILVCAPTISSLTLGEKIP